MADRLKLQIKRDDGEALNITAIPQYIVEGGDRISNGLYDLTSDALSDHLGQIAFHLDHFEEWEYIGIRLSENEQDQLAYHIRNSVLNK